MKHVKTILLFICITLLFVQCEKKFDGTNNLNLTADTDLTNGATTGQMTAIIDNQNWISNTVTAGLIQNLLNVTGIASDGSIITFTVDMQGIGKYPLNQNSLSVGAHNKAGGELSYTSNYADVPGGEFEITAHNPDTKLVSGTFHFHGQTMNDAVEITAGTFTDITYTSELPTVKENSFSVDIDGVAYTTETVNGVEAMNIITINAMKSDMSYGVGVVLPANIELGEYELTGAVVLAGINVLFYPTAKGNEVQNSKSGTLTVTLHDMANKRIEGTFSCTTESVFSGTSVLTNGKFASNYISY